MTALQAIRAGYGEISRRKKLVWTWYALNVLCAVVIIAPLVVSISGALGVSLENQRLFDHFDFSWMVEFGWSAQYQQFIPLSTLLALVGAAFVLMTTWLSGGALAVLRDPTGSFFAGCARWFPPFLRLFLWSLIGFGLALAVRAGVAALLSRITDDSMSAQPAAYGSMALFVISCTLFLLVMMIVDYAKIHMVTHDDRAARRGFVAALRFVFANFATTAAIFASLTLIGLLLFAVYHVWSEVIGQASTGAVLLLLIVRQVYVFARTWLRLLFLASERLYFESRLPVPKPAPVLPSSPIDFESIESYDSSLL